MKNRKMSKYAFVLLCLLSPCFVLAQQNFKYKAQLPVIDSDGFYRIALKPELVAKSQIDLADLRISDDKGHFVAYVISTNLPPGPQSLFTEFPLIKKEHPDSTTVVIIENKQIIPIRVLWLKLKNTEVDRILNLAGSDDNEHWYAIKEDIPLRHVSEATTDTYLQSVNFPTSTYRYLKITVNDGNKNPVDILQAGIYTERHTETAYFPINAAHVSQIDSAKTSFIHISFADNYRINKLHLAVGGPHFYNRHVSIYDETGKYPEQISEGELRSDRPTDLLLSVKTDSLLLEINNEDDQPLQVKSADAYQSGQYIISYLEKGKSYHLLTGNASAQMPVYDLRFFADSLSANVNTINHGSVTGTGYSDQKPVHKQNNNTFLFWGAIVVALLILLFLTFRMSSEVNKRQADNKEN